MPWWVKALFVLGVLALLCSIIIVCVVLLNIFLSPGVTH